MSTIQILGVERFPLDSKRLLGCFIDHPIAGANCVVYDFDCAGWVVGKESPALGIELVASDGPVRRIPIVVSRPDVAKEYPHAPKADVAGFWAPVNVIGMPEEFELTVQAALENGERVPIGRIRGRHRPIPVSFESTIQPLVLTSMGRTGTTWSLRLLSEHPAIVTYRVYPYEMRAGRYWMQLLGALTEPATQAQSSSRFGRLDAQWWVAHHPFSRATASSDPRLREWFGRRFVEQAADWCKLSVEDCYQEVAAIQNQVAPVYFAEKYLADEVPGIVWELYPKTREIFLVRDFRDMLCSIRAFNRQRGNLGFGRDLAASEQEYIVNVGREAKRLLDSWKSRKARTWLVRYEDLVLSPAETLVGILNYLGLDSSKKRIDEMITRASVETSELRDHRTTSGPNDSVGRWRRDLDPESQAVCEQVFRGILDDFGYSRSGPEELAGAAVRNR
jgi:hypothetical protein